MPNKYYRDAYFIQIFLTYNVLEKFYLSHLIEENLCMEGGIIYQW